MKTQKIILPILLIFIALSCNKEDISTSEIFNNVEDVLSIKNSPILSNKTTIQTPDWYNFKYIYFYNNWGIRITTLIQNDNVIGVYSEAINRPDYTHKGFAWIKVYSESEREYLYRITLKYAITTSSIDWGSGTNDYWWDYFENDTSVTNNNDVVDYFNDQNNSSISVSTADMTFWIKESDLNSVAGPANCINGHCPE